LETNIVLDLSASDFDIAGYATVSAGEGEGFIYIFISGIDFFFDNDGSGVTSISEGTDYIIASCNLYAVDSFSLRDLEFIAVNGTGD